MDLRVFLAGDQGAWLELAALLGFCVGLVFALLDRPDTDDQGHVSPAVRGPKTHGPRPLGHAQACPCVDCVAERARQRVMERAFGRSGSRYAGPPRVGPSASGCFGCEAAHPGPGLVRELETRVASEPADRRWELCQIVKLPVIRVIEHGALADYN